MQKVSSRQTAGPRFGQLILVIGGAASGKSAKALELAGEADHRIFLATGQPLDEEMAERIRRHQVSRGADWKTEEVPLELLTWFDENRHRYRVVVLDCVTLWLSNLLRSGVSEPEIPRLVTALLHAIHATRSRVIAVTNELGLGLVPFEAEARRFRDLAGQVNQQIAREADEVHFVAAGLSVRLK
jgi:adenosylcobinamide kinase/adenosylcobinamide-phosphate guanylyltransferase